MVHVKGKIKELAFSICPYFFPKFSVSKNDSECGVSLLLCHQDVCYAIYMLSSFFYQMRMSLPVFIVDDGSLTTSDKKLLSTHFTVQFCTEEDTHVRLRKILKPYPNIFSYRFSSSTHILKKKLLDATLLHPFKKYILFDADMLFFRCPKEIYAWIYSKENVLLYGAHDWKSTGREEDQEIIIRRLLRLFFPTGADIYLSSGLLCVPSTAYFHLDHLDTMLGFFKKTEMINRRLVENHAFTLLVGKQKANVLNKHAYINVWLLYQYTRALPKHVTHIHYAGDTRVFMQRDALELVLKNNFFR